MTSSHDNTVYDAEHRLEHLIAAGGQVRANGRNWELEPDTQFTTLASAALFCTLTCMEHKLPPVTVRHRRGDKSSHYEPDNATIALASWGGTRLTLCHELAHHMTRSRYSDSPVPVDDHGPQFRAAFLELLTATGAPQQAAFLRTAWAEHDLHAPIAL